MFARGNAPHILIHRMMVITLNNKNGTDQSRQGESVISRRRKETAYHCLDPWTAETSGKWPGGRKKSLSGNGDKEHGGTAISLRGGISEAVAILGGVAGSRCSVVAHRRDAVVRGQWLVHRHLMTAYRRQQ